MSPRELWLVTEILVCRKLNNIAKNFYSSANIKGDWEKIRTI